MDLMCNKLSSKGILELAYALKYNQGLTYLSICFYNDVSNNSINDRGAGYFADALKENGTLSKIGRCLMRIIKQSNYHRRLQFPKQSMATK